MLRVFIGWDDKEGIAAHVLQHSIRRRSSIPVSFTLLDRVNLRGIYDRPRGQFESTDFSISRFIVPYLCNYEGWAIFMDCDMLCLGDVVELARYMTLASRWNQAVQVVKHDYVPKACYSGTYGKTNMQQVREKERQASSEILQGVSRSAHEEDTSNPLGTESLRTPEGELPINGECVPKEGDVSRETLSDMREESREASRRLQQATSNNVALQEASSGDAQFVGTKFLGTKQYSYSKKNWSSMMIFNNPLCRNLTPEYVNTVPGLALHQFHWTLDEKLGSIPKIWNHLVGEENQSPPEEARLIHFTQGGPWFKEYSDCPFSKEWKEELKSLNGPG